MDRDTELQLEMPLYIGGGGIMSRRTLGPIAHIAGWSRSFQGVTSILKDHEKKNKRRLSNNK